ncbi:hypothetical protein BS78_05G084300 [Paspalum vaginatum]|nr:hypothetical protein BS78_05G084300 [Paspalum vaginatum]
MAGPSSWSSWSWAPRLGPGPPAPVSTGWRPARGVSWSTARTPTTRSVGGRAAPSLGTRSISCSRGTRASSEYDLSTRAMSAIELPREQTQPFIKLFGPIELTATVDGRLGFARVEKSRLCVWAMEEAKGARWALSQAIELEKVLPLPRKWMSKLFLVGSAEGVGVIFMTVEDQLFTVDLRSDQAMKIYEHPRLSNAMVVPYMSFFIPELRRTPSSDDGPSASASQA